MATNSPRLDDGPGGLVVSVSCSERRARRSRPGLPFAGLLGVAALHAHGQSEPEATARQFAIVPDLSIVQTFTDNSTLSSANRRSDSITRISPELRMSSNAGRVQGYFDYSLATLVYARGTESNSVQQTLSSAVKAEAIPNFASVDASANIARQNISALGTQSPDASLKTSNQTEVRSFSLSPNLHGRLGSFAAFEGRLNYATTHTGSDSIGNSTNTGGSAHIGSDGALSRWNWALDISRQISDFTQGRRTESDSGVGALIYNPVPELQFSARAGREANNVVSVDRQGNATYGAGGRWTPSERTTLSLQGDKRYFGSSYALNFEHRTARTVWTVSDTRDVSSDASAGAPNPILTQYGLLYLQLASRFPDPIERERQTLIELQRLGIDPASVAPGGFLSNAVSLQHNQTVSFAYLGLRTSWLVSAQQGTTRRLDNVSPAVNALPAGASIRQRILSASLSHRLTPASSTSLDVSQSQMTDLGNGSHVNLLSFTADWSSRLGQRTHVSFGARHSISSGGVSDYTESALLATLTLQF